MQAPFRKWGILCHTLTTMLSSDILEKQFGPTELVIIAQNANYRLIKTIAKKNQTVLEISFVRFDTPNINIFADVHQTVLRGSSMGKAFTDAGVQFVRTPRSVDHIEVLPDIQSLFGHVGLATIVTVDIFVGPKKVHYCHITEIYSPLVAWPDIKTPKSSHINQTLLEISTLLSRA
ncbi:hypothetical protein EPN95_02340 [Patescibacteria group bacterium]|nr:MAG: hypothetical protein EPN95_02340 [Patescibacteria group bacterium]